MSDRGHSTNGTDRDRTPTPREHYLPNGDLVAVDTRRSHFRGMRPTDAVTVPREKRPLYDLLLDILADVWVPDLMPARLACECASLVGARDTLEDIERGSVGIHGIGYGMGYCLRARDAIAEYRDREPLRLVAVGCSGSKHDVSEPTPAKSLYKGGYWTNKREYFEAFCDDGGRIISAEHALLHPDASIDYYEKTVDDLRGIPVDHDGRLPNGDDVHTLLDLWAYNVYNGLSRWLDDAAGGFDPRDVRLEILLGKNYEKPLKDRGVFEALRIPGNLEVSFPFREVDGLTGIGKQRGWMSDQVASARAVATDGGCNVQAGGEQR